MGLLDAFTTWIRNEARDVKASLDRTEDRLDADLTRRERELNATPEERMEMIQAEAGSSDALADIQNKIDGAQAKAEANADLLDPDNES